MAVIATEVAPKGVVGMMIGPDGAVWAEATDFRSDGYGGFTLAQAQQIRCRTRLRVAFFHRTCSDHVANIIGEYEAEQLLRKMKGFTERFILVGHGDAS